MIVGLGLGFSASPVLASSLTYTPTNPTFGGNPLNGTFLLSTAQAQGAGANSGQNSPNLSGLESALSGIGSGSVVVCCTSTPTNP